jgi:hypothetical protein
MHIELRYSLKWIQFSHFKTMGKHTKRARFVFYLNFEFVRAFSNMANNLVVEFITMHSF